MNPTLEIKNNNLGPAWAPSLVGFCHAGPNFRPTILIKMYWSEVIVIEEKAHFLEPVYLEAA